MEDKVSLKGVWLHHVTNFIWGIAVKFCTQGDCIKPCQKDDKSPPKKGVLWSHDQFKFVVFSARCNIYISRLCHDASPSVHLSVTFVHCCHRVQWIPDISACLDRWMSLLLTDNAWPLIVGRDDARISGGRGGYGISNFLSYSFTWKCIWMFSVISVENALCQKTVRLITTSA